MKIIKDRFELIKKYIEGKEVLDLGSTAVIASKKKAILKNRPNLYKRMKEIAKDIVGVDVKGDNSEIIKGNVVEINLNRKFDIVVMGGIINHIENHKDLIENAKRHLKESGCLIITTLNVRSWRVLFDKQTPEIFEGSAHVSLQSIGTLKNLLKRHGMEIIDGAYYYGNKAFYPFPMWIFGKYQQAMVVVAKRKIK